MLGIVVRINPNIFAKTIGDTRAFILNDEITGYSHEISTDGGYRTATINVTMKQHLIEEAFTTWLGRDVVVTTASGEIVFNGYINSLIVNTGVLSNEKIGPISDICNRVSTRYSLLTYDESTGEPSVPISTMTTIDENKSSQSLYGIVERVISIGNASTNEASRINSMYLSEYAWPETSGSLRFDVAASTPTSMSIEVEGYYAWLDNYIYSNLNFGIISISQKIYEIIASDPNNIFVKSDAYIDDNPYLVRKQELENESAWTIIKRLLSYGDASDNRYTFMVRHDRYIEYKKVTSSIKYFYSTRGEPTIIDALTRNKVDPILVKPGEWIQAIDWLTSFSYPSLDTNNQPRNKFIESVRFTAPNTLEIIGSKTRRVGMAIAKLGLGGIA